ncbi:MAG: tRNA (adenosine(37)-N6)-dimethylallyltransferase MiaA [Ignavibacteria bacterium]|nr:tRNA (adenosine(37)-N6)-dimethylallyltransferase MiaA [Ignavibacteria bacterium]
MVSIPFEECIEKKIAIAIVGPTAIGKTRLSLFFAEHLPIEIVSADSRQVYKYLDIGTAKPTLEERKIVPHYFIDICNPDDYYSAGQFGKDAENVVNEIFSKRKIPIIVGGSGLYIKALCEGFFEEPYTYEDKIKAQKIRKELSFLSKEALYSKLQEVDPETASLYPDKNYVRLIRALEFYLLKGIPISIYRRTFHRKPNFNTIYVGLICNRDYLYSIINQRVKRMWDIGLVDEVKKILNLGYSPELNSLKSVGYKETIDYLFGRLSETEALELIQRNTRRFAKRQITWFKKVNFINWFDVSIKNFEKNILSFLSNYIEKVSIFN